MTASQAMKKRYAPRIGERIGDLVFLQVADKQGENKRAYGEFSCNCGNIALLPLARILNQKRMTHCGCKTNHTHTKTHGMRYSSEYQVWRAMKFRCLNPNSKDYPRYGGAGVSLCNEWVESFEAFYEYIGPRPSGTTIDRINNLEGYKPGNVRWASASQQARNRRATYVWHIKGLVFETCQEAANHFGLSDMSIYRWVRGSFDKRRNLFTKPKSDCFVTPRYPERGAV